jgi:lipoprotein-anchoring transpeptidase ErfK/SrfK
MTAGRSGAPPRRPAALALGVASALIASLAFLTATVGPAGVTQAMAGPPPPPPPPVPAAVVAIQDGVSTPISPSTPVGVSVAHGTLRTVQIADAAGRVLPGTLAPDAASWHTSQPLEYGATYQVSVTAVGEDQREVHQDGTVRTLRPAALASVSLRPDLGADTVGVGQPLIARFSRSVTDRAAAEKALAVTTTPAQPGGWYWISATEAHYRAENYWQPGTTIQLDVHLFGVDLGKGTFGQVDRSVTVHVHDSWVAKADGAAKTMQVFHNGSLVRTMPVSLGSAKNPSHVGPHVISDKKPSVIMDSCTYGVCEGDPGYYKEKVDLDLRISGDGEFVHSAPWSVRQQGSRNVSHGCVNLSPANARWFFDHFNVGDVVEITNSGGPPLPIWDTYGDWVVSWAEWRAGGAT